MATKLVICVRRDIKMGKGKLAAQVGHAAVTAALSAKQGAARTFDAWMRSGQPKVVVKVDDLEALERVERKAQDAKLHTERVTDAGRTQLDPGTTTCLAVGPDDADKIDAVTGDLKLL